LLAEVRQRTTSALLVGTWAAARWAVAFYEKHGFHLVPASAKDQLLAKYWSIPKRQRETSVVLIDGDISRWRTLI
jgi:hypothetical protein